jgi:hypothetical protein
MTRPPAPDSSRGRGVTAKAFRGGAVAVLLLGCPQLLDDSFGAAGTEGGAAVNAGTGGSLAAGWGGAAGDGGSGGTTSATGCRFGDFSSPELIAGLGRSDALYGPSLAGNGLVLAFSESIEEGPEDIYLSQRSAPDGAFGSALPAPGINGAKLFRSVRSCL